MAHIYRRKHILWDLLSVFRKWYLQRVLNCSKSISVRLSSLEDWAYCLRKSYFWQFRSQPYSWVIQEPHPRSKIREQEYSSLWNTVGRFYHLIHGRKSQASHLFWILFDWTEVSWIWEVFPWYQVLRILWDQWPLEHNFESHHGCLRMHLHTACLLSDQLTIYHRLDWFSVLNCPPL